MMRDPMLATRALSIQQPWADAIIHGTKRVENRTWKRETGGKEFGWLWVHAPAGYDKAGDLWMREQGLHTPVAGAPRSALIGLAYIHTISNGALDAGDPWAFGPWCWCIGEVIALDEMVPCKGALGLWTVPDAPLAVARMWLDIIQRRPEVRQ